jgi:hypothetical protein
LSPRVTFSEIPNEEFLVLLGGKTCKVQIFRKQVDSGRGRSMENLAHVLFERLDRRQVAPLGEGDQYRPFCRGWNVGNSAGHKEQNAVNEGAQLDESA